MAGRHAKEYPMELFKHAGKVHLRFDSESEIRRLREIMLAVNRAELAKTFAALSTEELDEANQMIYFGLKMGLFVDHLPECKEMDPFIVIDNVEGAVHDAHHLSNRSFAP